MLALSLRRLATSYATSYASRACSACDVWSSDKM